MPFETPKAPAPAGALAQPRVRSARRGWGIGLLAAALLAAAGVGWVVRGSDRAYAHGLVSYGDKHGEPNRYANLDEGAAQLSLGSPDGHRLVVQWRDPDGHGWPAPTTVWENRKAGPGSSPAYREPAVTPDRVRVGHTGLAPAGGFVTG